MRAVADDGLRDRVLGLEIDPGGNLPQRKIRIEELAVLLEAVDVENVAERSVLDPGADLPQGGRVAEREPDLGLDARGSSGAGQSEGLSRVPRDRLLAQHVLAGCDRRHAEIEVRVGRRADVDHLHLGSANSAAGRVIDATDAELLRHGGGSFRHDVADGHQINAGVGGVARQMRLFRPGVCPEYAHAQFSWVY